MERPSSLLWMDSWISGAILILSTKSHRISIVSGIYSLTYVDSSQVGNTPIQLCPKGISDGSDVGDNSKDRILATNGVPSEESHFYRVDNLIKR